MVVSGSVQGVGYRNFARRTALELGISGHAINLPDGRVEVVACGETAALEQFVDRLRAGPKWSNVSGLTCSDAACVGTAGFRCG